MTVLFITVAFLIAATVTFIIEEGRSKYHLTKLMDQNSSARTYFIDLSSNKVRYFDSINLGNVRVTSLGKFYARFPQPGQRKVIDWVKELAYGSEGASEYIEVPITIAHTGGQMMTMLQADHVDTENGTLRINSFLLNFTPTTNKVGENKQVSTLEEYAAAVTPNLKKKKGMSACFLFTSKRRSDMEGGVDRVIMTQIKSALVPLLVGKRLLLCPSDNEIVLADTSIYESTRALPLIREAKNLINAYLSLNSLLSEIDYRIGVVYHADEKGPEEVLERARETASYAFDTPEGMIIYQKGKSILTSPVASYRTEIERIINDKKISYFFRPIYSVKEKKVVGYLSKQEPIDTYFGTMDDVKNYASRSGDAESLFSTLFRRTLPLFIAQRQDEDQLLFFPVRVDDLPFMMRIVAKSVKARETKNVFLFNEADLRDHVNFANPESFIDEITRIKAKGHGVGLLINKPELGLSELIYSVFDHFICSFASSSSVTMDNDDRVRILLHALPERLLRYDKPIVISDLESWSAIGLVIHSGLTLLSSEQIGKFDEMIEPLPPKILKKLKDASR